MYVCTYIHLTYTHTYIRTYIHTYVHTCTYKHMKLYTYLMTSHNLLQFM